MCLEKISERKIAEDDITVYKIIKYDNRIGEYFTPFMNKQIKIGETYNSELVVLNCGYNAIVQEGLHSFPGNCDLMILIEYMGLNFFKYKNCNFFIFKCIIPKNSKFYCGKFDISCFEYDYDYIDSIASDTLTYVEKITS